MGEMRDKFTELTTSKEFSEWSKTHEDSYLTYGMIIKGSTQWQFGYYDPNKDRMTSFTMDDPIAVAENQEVFKEHDTVERLNLDVVELSMSDADHIVMEKASESQTGTVLKKICILQHIQEFGTVWNITYVLSSLKAFNVKVHAQTKEIQDIKVTSLAQFAQKDDGSSLSSQSDNLKS